MHQILADVVGAILWTLILSLKEHGDIDWNSMGAFMWGKIEQIADGEQKVRTIIHRTSGAEATREFVNFGSSL